MLLDLDGVEEVELAGVGEVDYELTEEGVLPGEPGAGELARIILIKGLVHKAGAGVGLHQGLHAPFDLLVILRCKGLHHDAHWPDVVVADVRAADSLAGLAFEEIRIVLAPDKPAGVLVDRIVDVNVSEIGHCQEARNVGVIHQEPVAETIHLEGEDLTVLGVVHDGIFIKSLLHFGGEVKAFLCEFLVVINIREDLGGLAQRGDSEEVGWNEELEDRRVIRRTECRGDQAYRLDRVAAAVIGLGVELAVGLAGEPVRARAVLALLLLEGLESGLDGLEPCHAEHGIVSGHLPVLVGQADRVAVRVNLPFAFVVVRVHVGEVRIPLAARRAVVEGVGVRVDADQGELAVDHAGEHIPKMLVLIGKLDVRPDLRAGVPQPHGVDVTGVNEGPEVAVVVLAEVYGGVKGVRVAVGEHPGEALVLQDALHLGDLVLDGLGAEKTLFWSRTLRLVGFGVARGSRFDRLGDQTGWLDDQTSWIGCQTGWLGGRLVILPNHIVRCLGLCQST